MLGAQVLENYKSYKTSTGLGALPTAGTITGSQATTPYKPLTHLALLPLSLSHAVVFIVKSKELKTSTFTLMLIL